MMTRYKAAALLTICSLLAATCKEINMVGVKKAEFNRSVTLSVYEKAVNSENGLLLEVFEINDSRCPVNVNCIWAGNAKVKLSISGTDMEKADLNFCLGQCDKQFQEADTVLFQQDDQSYTLILTKVEPYPGTANRTKTATLILKKN